MVAPRHNSGKSISWSPRHIMQSFTGWSEYHTRKQGNPVSNRGLE